MQFTLDTGGAVSNCALLLLHLWEVTTLLFCPLKANCQQKLRTVKVTFLSQNPNSHTAALVSDLKYGGAGQLASRYNC